MARTVHPAFLISAAALAQAAFSPDAAAQFQVTETYDAPAVNPAISPDVEPAVPGVQSTLRSVIQHINTQPAGQAFTVTLPSGTFLFTRVGAGEDSAVSGDIDIHREVVITGSGLGVTFLDAGALGDRLFDVRAGVRVRFETLGVYNATAIGGESGGAVRAVAGSALEFDQCELSMNSASGGTTARGGAIDAQGSLSATGFCNFYGNTATGIGGAIYLNGAGILDDCHFYVNHSDRDGGAIRTTSASPSLRVTNSSFDGDSSGGSGGAMNLRSPAEIDSCVFMNAHAVAVGGSVGLLGASVRVTNSTFLFNRSDSGGGAINVAGGGDLFAENCLFEANSSQTSGGAITNSSVCRVGHSAFIANTADALGGPELGGGAIYNFATLELTNSTLSGNACPGGLGGAILNLTGGNASLTHVTLAENGSPNGAAIHNGTPSGGATMHLTHTIVAGVPGSVDPLVMGSSLPLSSLGYNLDSDGTAGLAGPGDIGGTLGAPVDPHLSPLGLHGGPTPTHILLAGSPCINAGNVAFSVDPAGNVVTDDQRHEPRPQGTPDIGAVEMHCPADFNLDGVRNFFDVADFVTAYNNQDPRADLAAPFGVFNFFDVAAFIALYNAGCP
tara:strand:+ start:15683 stop:17527 length:1845 start_codon:yes stop_codon:yes gene_type:complete